jgi:hypothetical protein
MARYRQHCEWSVWNRYTPTRYCGRRTVDGRHCAQHANMAAKIEASNDKALADLRAAFGEAPDE